MGGYGPHIAFPRAYNAVKTALIVRVGKVHVANIQCVDQCGFHTKTKQHGEVVGLAIKVTSFFGTRPTIYPDPPFTQTHPLPRPPLYPDPPFTQTHPLPRPTLHPDPPFTQAHPLPRPTLYPDPPFTQTHHLPRPTLYPDPPFTQTLHTLGC